MKVLTFKSSYLGGNIMLEISGKPYPTGNFMTENQLGLYPGGNIMSEIQGKVYPAGNFMPRVQFGLYPDGNFVSEIRFGLMHGGVNLPLDFGRLSPGGG